MIILCPDIRINIYSFLKNNNLRVLKLVYKKDKNYIDEIIENNKILMKKYIYHFKYQYFNDTFLPIELIKKLPFIDYKKHHTGGTHYIDGVRKKDMTKPIMIGIDRYKRPFISIKYISHIDKIKQFDEEHEFNPGTKVITLFQRYTDTKSQWCKAGINSYHDPLLFHTSTCLQKKDKKLIVRNILELLEGQDISYPEYSYGDEFRSIKKMKITLE